VSEEGNKPFLPALTLPAHFSGYLLCVATSRIMEEKNWRGGKLQFLETQNFAVHKEVRLLFLQLFLFTLELIYTAAVGVILLKLVPAVHHIISKTQWAVAFFLYLMFAACAR